MYRFIYEIDNAWIIGALSPVHPSDYKYTCMFSQGSPISRFRFVFVSHLHITPSASISSVVLASSDVVSMLTYMLFKLAPGKLLVDTCHWLKNPVRAEG